MIIATRLRTDAATRAAPLTLERIRSAVAEVLGVAPAAIGDDDDLIRLGIDSVRIMRLANLFRRGGVEVKFAELIERPTVGTWWAIASERLATPASPPQHPPVEVDEAAPFDLAAMQQAYWIGRDDGQVLGGVNAHYYVELDGARVEPERLERAVRALLERHGMLRARFTDDGRQRILPESPWPGIALHDLRSEPGDAVAQALQALRSQLSQRRLAVERGEVFDVQLSLLPGGATRLHLNIDMLVSDAQSFQLILDEMARLYVDPERPLAQVAYSFPRYLAEQTSRRTDAHERARAYWQARIDELPGAPQLPLAVEPERLVRNGVGHRWHWLPGPDRDALAERSRAHGRTLPVVLATAFAEVLAAWSAEPRFLLNLPLFDREVLHPDVPLLVGDFTNLIVLAVDASGEMSFADRARGLQAQLRSDAGHAEYSGLEVLRDLARSRPGDWMMAPVVFTSAIGMGDLFGDEVRRCFGVPGWTSSQTPQVWLDHQVTERDGGLAFNWDVVEGLFCDGVVDAMFEAYLRLVRWLSDPASDWALPVPPLLPERQARVRAAANATDGPEPDRLLHSGFFERAAERPDRLALAWGDDGRLTYGELAGQALRIAALLRSRGIHPGEAVAVTLPRGAHQIAAVLGVLAAGGVYVPVGVDQPLQRRARIYANAQARIVLAECMTLEWPDVVEVLDVDAAAAVAALEQPVEVGPDALAYVIYTSGSTGEPKGVEVTHRAAMNTVADVNGRFDIGADDRVLAVSALDFDLSVYDMFGLLSAGGALVLITDEDRREARRWLELIRRFGVTVWNSVPALVDMLLIAGTADDIAPSLRLVLVSGDWVGTDLPGRLAAQRPGCRFVALGGATEAAIWSNALEVGDVLAHWRSIPYGRPLRNQRYRAVDARGRDCPDWVPGELWIGGLGVARSYRCDPERTARQFVDHEGGRWYRTGDLGRYWPDGTLEFLGRADLQVKIRGHRVEPGEIEAALEAHPSVARAAVTAIGAPAKRIGAAVVVRDGGPDAAALRRFAADRLPAHMVPTDLVAVEELPLSGNGKVDRKALAGILVRHAADASDEPRGAVESAIATIWAVLLDVASVGRGSSFFALGGDSLIATRLVEALRARFGVEVSLRQFFVAPTVAELAALIGEAEEGVI